MLNTPVDRIRCSLVGELRVPARVSSLSVQPSPLSGRVGVHIVTFEACSSFTRVTACRVAHPPFVGFIARLRPGRLPGSGARKLPSSTNNLLGWVLPPLVTCAVEAHPISPCIVHNPPWTFGRPSNRTESTYSASARVRFAQRAQFPEPVSDSFRQAERALTEEGLTSYVNPHS